MKMEFHTQDNENLPAMVELGPKRVGHVKTIQLFVKVTRKILIPPILLVFPYL